MKEMNLSLLGSKKNTPLFIFIYVLLVGSIEYVLRDFLTQNFDISISILYLNIFTSLLLFLLILIIFKILAPTLSLSKISNHVFSFFWLKTLSPLINHLDGASVKEVALLRMEESGQNIFMMGFSDIGLVFVIYSFAILASFLVFKHTGELKTLRKALSRGAATFFAVILSSLVVYLKWRIDLNLGEKSITIYKLFTFSIPTNTFDISGLDHMYMNFNRSYILWIVLILVEISIASSTLFYLTDKKTFKSLFKNIKPFRTLHFAFMVLIGMLVVREVEPMFALDPINVLHIPFIIIPIFCMMLTWQFTAILNDIYDIEIDMKAHPDRPLIRGFISERVYLEIAMIAAILSLILSLLLGLSLFLLNLTFILAAIAYSIPPLRLKNRVFGYICVGYASVISFLFGVYSPRFWYLGIGISSDKLVRKISFFPDIFFISVLIFVVLSISPLINAVRDYEADKRSGVKSLYTIYGFETGKKIVAVLIVVLFLSPLLLINEPIDILVLTPISLSAALVFHKREDHRYVFGLYFIVILFSLLRFIKFL